MIAFAPMYPLTCQPEDILKAQEQNRITNWFCSDVHVRGEYPAYMTKYFKEHDIPFDYLDEEGLEGITPYDLMD